MKACNNDLKTAEFFVEWMRQGRQAQQAYKVLYPHVTDESAAVLGSKLLSKVNRELLLEAYGLTADRYMTKVNEGLDAEKWNEYTGEREADYRTQYYYVNMLGKLTKLDSGNNINIQNNTVIILPNDLANKYNQPDIVGSTETDSPQQ